MAERAVARIRKKLAPGYTLVQVQPGAGMGVYEVRDPGGAPVFDDNSGAPIRFGDTEHYRSIEASLRRVGAIPQPPARSFRPHAAAISREKAASNPIIMAKDILADSQASPRERRIAKAFLALLQRHEGVRELAKKLGQRLSEYQEDED